MRRALAVGGFGALLCGVAAAFDGESLYVPGVALVLLAGVAAAWVAGAARGVRVERVLGGARVEEDESLEVRLRVRAGAVPLPGGRIAEPLLGGELDLPPGWLGRSVRRAATFPRRGRYTLAPVEVVISDPLGLCSRTVTSLRADEVLVLPRVERVRSLGGAGGPRSSARGGRPEMGGGVELDGVRAHRPGTPASRIYWPALARGAGLMERRLQAEADSTPLVALDAGGPRDAAHRDGLDAAVRATASLALMLARAGGVAVLLPGDRRPVTLDATLAGWPHLHARLAVVEAGGRAAARVPGSRSGPVILVSAVPSARHPRLLARGSALPPIHVVAGSLPGRRPAFAVAGCHGYTTGRTRVARGHAA
jgi:uncharacterized protein (DUF58 family)